MSDINSTVHQYLSENILDKVKKIGKEKIKQLKS